MPKEQERPGMFAPPETRRPRDISQPLTRGRASSQEQAQRNYCEQHRLGPYQMHTAALQTQLSYQHGAPAPAQPSPFVPAIPVGNFHPTSIVQQPQVIQQATSQRSRSAIPARRSRVVNSVLYTSSINEAPSQHVSRNTERGLDNNCGQSRLAGCTILHSDPPVIAIQGSHQQEESWPSYQQRPQLFAPPPARLSHRRSPASRLSPSGLLHSHHDKPVPIPPPISEANPPDTNKWGVVASQQIARPHHRELFYDEQTLLPPRHGPPPLPRLSSPAELEGSQPQFTVPESNTPVRSTRLETRDYLERHRGIQRIEPDPGVDGLQQHQHLFHAVESQGEPPVVPGVALNTSSSRCDGEARPAMTWYEFYKGKRTWEFEDLKDAYERILGGSESTLGGPDESTESKSD